MYKILLIDDDDFCAFLTRKVIEETVPITWVDIALEGREGLNYLHLRQKVNDFPHFIIVDLDMPGMSGFDFLDAYSQEFMQQYINTKIIVLTSSMREKDRTRALSYNVVSHFIQKPYTEELVKETIIAVPEKDLI